MQRILDELLCQDARVEKPPTHKKKVFTNHLGNQLWIRVYKQENGYCLATTLVRFPSLLTEVEMKYDTGRPGPGQDPLAVCIQGVATHWGFNHFIEFAKHYLPQEERPNLHTRDRLP